MAEEQNAGTDGKGESQEDLPIMRGASEILALAGVIVGAASLLLAFFTPGGEPRVMGTRNPPSLLALNLAFCAMLMGVLAVYRVRGMAGQGLVRAGALAALLMGLAGPVVYARQAVTWRLAMQTAEMENLNKIGAAARVYAKRHSDMFPPDLEMLVTAGLLERASLQTPYADKPDYVYLGEGMRLEMVKEGTPLILAHAPRPRGKMAVPVVYADGRTAVINSETELEAAQQANVKAREAAGLPEKPATQPLMPATRAAAPQ